jgi:hypothetical protein
MIEMEEAYKDVNQREYRLDVTEVENGHVAKVSKTNANAKQFVVFKPKEETLGSRFGSCTCGVPATEGIPCRHMVVLAKSNVIHGLTRVKMMPLWWTTAQWCNQFPIRATMRSDITMNAIKTRHSRDELLRYCPVWSAAAKKGCPKKHKRRKSIMDHIKESAKKKRKRTNRMFCSICEKFNHITFVLSVKNSTTTQRTAIKSKWMEYRVTSTMIWALKLVTNWRSTLRSLFDMFTKILVVLFGVFGRERIMENNDKCDILTVLQIQV